MMKTLVIAEHDNKELVSASLNAITAALELGLPVELLVAGENASAVAEQAASIEGLGRVVQVDASHYGDQLAENLAQLVIDLVKRDAYSCVVCASTSAGKNLAPRIAALLDVAQVSDVIKINSLGNYIRPIYAGNIMLTVESQESVQVLTIRPTAFDQAGQGPAVEICQAEASINLELSSLVRRELTVSDRPGLAQAPIVVSGGRGLGNGENYQTILEPLADKLGAALGASRAAVDAGYVANDYQVGQTGKVVAPELYIAVGISGAIQHLAGMSGSKIIVAINKDPDAPIFQVADYALEADLFTATPALTASL
jgi:electron transfer flavoprotein alpha subunit